MPSLAECSGDHSRLTSLAFVEISKKLGMDLSDWTGPVIAAEHKHYKLDWHAPDPSENFITLYDDGAWEFYGENSAQGKISPLHHNFWLNRLKKSGTPGAIAFFAVEFFKNLRK